MSKERLEDIKNKAIKDTVVITNKETNKINYGHSFTLLDEDYQYIMEQAERAQELEEEVSSLHWRNEWIKSQEQNNRYREAIDKAIESCCYDAAITDLKKFMESESK